MRSVVRQSIKLPASGEQLFKMYLSAEAHSAFTGSPATIGDSHGAPFLAFDGMLSGTILELVRPTLIVQSWRSVNFRDSDPDSTLILSFTTVGDEGQVDLIHVDVPEQDYEGVSKGWEKFYWTPWRVYLESAAGSGEV